MEVMPGYKKTEVGLIPVDWDSKLLGEIGDSLIGLTCLSGMRTGDL